MAMFSAFQVAAAACGTAIRAQASTPALHSRRAVILPSKLGCPGEVRPQGERTALVICGQAARGGGWHVAAGGTWAAAGGAWAAYAGTAGPAGLKPASCGIESAACPHSSCA